MEINRVIVGELQTNCYILILDNKCLVIDPGDEYNKIKKYIKDKEVVGVIVTHYHFDHIGVLNYFDKSLILDRSNLEEKEYELSDILRIVAKVKKVTKEEILVNLNSLILNFEEQIILDTLLNKLYKDNIPLQYILGKQYFYKEEYEVDENVLIPRADTEILVEKAIEYINKENLETIIDMCTGSGAIAVSLAKYIENEKHNKKSIKAILLFFKINI